jgi:hypothetical protein
MEKNMKYFFYCVLFVVLLALNCTQAKDPDSTTSNRSVLGGWVFTNSAYQPLSTPGGYEMIEVKSSTTLYGLYNSTNVFKWIREYVNTSAGTYSYGNNYFKLNYAPNNYISYNFIFQSDDTALITRNTSESSYEFYSKKVSYINGGEY